MCGAVLLIASFLPPSRGDSGQEVRPGSGQMNVPWRLRVGGAPGNVSLDQDLGPGKQREKAGLL